MKLVFVILAVLFSVPALADTCALPCTITAPTTTVSISGSPGGMIPGGRLTLVSGKPVLDADVTSNTLWYAPFNSDTYPVLDSSLSWQIRTFSASPTDAIGISMTGGAKWAAGSSRDAFGTSSGALCTGPAWSGSDLASRKLIRYNGILVNAEETTCDTSETESISCPQYQCTYLGSITSSVAGQLTAQFSYGQNRKFEIWTAYAQNQVEIVLRVGAIGVQYNPTNQYNSALPNDGFLPFGPSGGDPLNRANVFTGLPTHVDVTYHQSAFINTSTGSLVGIIAGIGWNGNLRGYWMKVSSDAAGVAAGTTGAAHYVETNATGLNTATQMIARANGNTGTVWGGAASPPWSTNDINSVLLATYKG